MTAKQASEKRKRPASRKKAGDRWLTPAEAADRLGVTVRWLRSLTKQGMPRESGRAGRYPWPGVREWYTKHLEQKVIERVQPSSLTDERAAYTRTRRELAEIELRKRQGEVVEIADVSRIWGEFLDKLRAILLNLPATLAPRVVGVKTVRQAMAQLDEGVREILSLLQAVGDEYGTAGATKPAKRGTRKRKGR